MAGRALTRLVELQRAMVLYGGAGDDMLNLLIPPGRHSFRRVDGGSGVDTLHSRDTGLNLDFTDPTVLGKFRSVEVLSLFDLPAMGEECSDRRDGDARSSGGACPGRGPRQWRRSLTDPGEVLLRVHGLPGGHGGARGRLDARDGGRRGRPPTYTTLGSAKVLIDEGLYTDG